MQQSSKTIPSKAHVGDVEGSTDSDTDGFTRVTSRRARPRGTGRGSGPREHSHPDPPHPTGKDTGNQALLKDTKNIEKEHAFVRGHPPIPHWVGKLPAENLPGSSTPEHTKSFDMKEKPPRALAIALPVTLPDNAMDISMEPQKTIQEAPMEPPASPAVSVPTL